MHSEPRVGPAAIVFRLSGANRAPPRIVAFSADTAWIGSTDRAPHLQTMNEEDDRRLKETGDAALGTNDLAPSRDWANALVRTFRGALDETAQKISTIAPMLARAPSKTGNSIMPRCDDHSCSSSQAPSATSSRKVAESDCDTSFVKCSNKPTGASTKLQCMSPKASLGTIQTFKSAPDQTNPRQSTAVRSFQPIPSTFVAPKRTALEAFTFQVEMDEDADDTVPNAALETLSRAERSVMNSLIMRLESLGMIRRSKSRFSSQALLTIADGRDSLMPTAKRGNVRAQLGLNWRTVNAFMTPRYLPKHKPKIIQASLLKARFFSRIDLRSGYLRMRIREDCRKYTAFDTPIGKYEWCVAPPGLRGVEYAFTNAISRIFPAHTFWESVLVLPSALVVFSETREQHAHDLTTVVETLWSAGLEPNAWGSSYYAKGVEIQGLWIHDGTLEVAKSRYAALEDLELGSSPCPGIDVLALSHLKLESSISQEMGAIDIRQRVLNVLRADPRFLDGPFILYVVARTVPEKKAGGYLVRSIDSGDEEMIAFASLPVNVSGDLKDRYAVAICACLEEFRPLIMGQKVEVRCGEIGDVNELLFSTERTSAVLVSNLVREFSAYVTNCSTASDQIASMMATTPCSISAQGAGCA